MQPIARHKSMRGAIVRLLPGDRLTLRADKVESVRSLCSTLGFSMKRKYKTHADRVANTVTVTRIY